MSAHAKIAVVGAGAFGTALASVAAASGGDVTLIGRASQISFGAVGTALSSQLEHLHRSNGVDLRLSTAVTGVSPGANGLQVELQGDRATVRFSAVASGGSGRWVPDRVQAWEIVSGWREEDGQWRLYYAEWTPK